MRDHEEPPTAHVGLLVLIVALLAVIGVGAGWSYLDYASRASVPYYWWRVTAIALLVVVVLRLFEDYQALTERTDEHGPPDDKIKISELSRDMAFISYSGATAWSFANTPARSFVVPLALLAAGGLIYIARRTQKFLEELEHRRYRTAASPAEWGWLVLAIFGLGWSGKYGPNYLGAGVATAIAVPFTLFLRHREAEALALLPPEPTPALPPPDLTLDEAPNEATGADRPWDGIPPIKPLL